MSLKTFVKISAVSNLSDARYCAGMGVDQLGFNLNPTDKDAITVAQCLEISNWVAGVQCVGEFGDMPVAEIATVQSQLPLDIIEVSVLEHIEKVHLFGKPLSFRLHVTDKATIQQLKSHLSYLDELVEQVVITTADETFNDAISKAVAYYHGHIRLIRGYGLSLDELGSPTNFGGIELKGSREEKPGFKEYGDMMDFLEALEVD